MAGLDIGLNSLIIAKLAKLAQKIIVPTNKKQSEDVQIKNFNFNDFLDILIKTLQPLETKNISDKEKYLKEIKAIKDFLIDLKTIENENNESLILHSNFNSIIEILTLDATPNKKNMEKINDTINKFINETSTSQTILWCNSITNTIKEIFTFCASSIAITGAAKNTLSLGKNYDLWNQWLTKDIFNPKDIIGNLVRYVFLYPSTVIFQKALKIINLPIDKPFDKLSDWLNKQPTWKKISLAAAIFGIAIATSNIIKTEASLIAADDAIEKSFNSLLEVISKPETWLFFTSGTVTDILNCYIKNTYEKWMQSEIKQEIKPYFPLELLKAFEQENNNISTNNNETEINETTSLINRTDLGYGTNSSNSSNNSEERSEINTHGKIQQSLLDKPENFNEQDWQHPESSSSSNSSDTSISFEEESLLTIENQSLSSDLNHFTHSNSNSNTKSINNEETVIEIEKENNNSNERTPLLQQTQNSHFSCTIL